MTDPDAALDQAIHNVIDALRDDPRLILGWALVIAHEGATDTGSTSYLTRTSPGQAAHSTLGLLELAIGQIHDNGEDDE